MMNVRIPPKSENYKWDVLQGRLIEPAFYTSVGTNSSCTMIHFRFRFSINLSKERLLTDGSRCQLRGLPVRTYLSPLLRFWYMIDPDYGRTNRILVHSFIFGTENCALLPKVPFPDCHCRWLQSFVSLLRTARIWFSIKTPQHRSHKKGGWRGGPEVRRTLSLSSAVGLQRNTARVFLFLYFITS